MSDETRHNGTAFSTDQLRLYLAIKRAADFNRQFFAEPYPSADDR